MKVSPTDELDFNHSNVLIISVQPHRMRMTHNLIVNYRLYHSLDVFVSGCSRNGSTCALTLSPKQRPQLVDYTEMTRFHSDDYINFLRTITPDNMNQHLRQLQRCELNLRVLEALITLSFSCCTNSDISQRWGGLPCVRWTV